MKDHSSKGKHSFITLVQRGTCLPFTGWTIGSVRTSGSGQMCFGPGQQLVVLNSISLETGISIVKAHHQSHHHWPCFRFCFCSFDGYVDFHVSSLICYSFPLDQTHSSSSEGIVVGIAVCGPDATTCYKRALRPTQPRANKNKTEYLVTFH